MNIRLVLQVVGRVLIICGCLMLPAVLVALIYKDSGLIPMLTGAGITIAVGAGFQFLSMPTNKNLHSREGFAIVALCWVLMGLFGAIPFLLSGYFGGYINCVFETVSGFTTTGATILSEIESIPKSILFWRSFTHWIGGMGILVLTMALIPQIGSRSLFLLRAESTGPNPDKILPRASKSAKTLYLIYVAMSLLETVVLYLCGMSPYDALVHMFSTAGTGGFSNYNTSVGYFDNAAVDVVISIFMLLFSLNFTVVYRMIRGDRKALVRNTESIVFFGIIAFSTIAIAIGIRGMYSDFWTSLRHSLFQVSSIASTTGFTTQNFDLWPVFTQIILLMLMIIGGCAGSTAGGIKVIRVILLFKGAAREIRSFVHPHSVRLLRLDGHTIDEDMSASISLFFFCYIAVLIISVFLVSFNNMDMTTTFTSVVACITNTGPGLSVVGPIGNYGGMNALSKIVLTICMLVGRLDIYPILLFFTKDMWKRN